MESNGVKRICKTYLCKPSNKTEKKNESYEEIKYLEWLTKKNSYQEI